MLKRWRMWLASAFLVLAGVFLYLFPPFAGNEQPYEGTELDGDAPDFGLIDQNGTFVRLSDFRGKVVVLTFMDSRCKDTCPITGAHFRKAYGQLSENEASQVVFIGVNVNVQANTVADVLATTRAWRLDEIPNWHFLTGSGEELEPVWNDYKISTLPSPEGTSIMHTPGTFLIDASGRKRWYVSTSFSDADDPGSAPQLNELLVQHIRELLKDR